MAVSAPPDPADGQPLRVLVRPATAHGWMRRPELDSDATRCWEAPDGALVAWPAGVEPPYVVTVPGGFPRVVGTPGR